MLTGRTFRSISLQLLVGLLGLTAAQAQQETNPLKLVKGVITDGSSGKPVDGGMVYAYIGTDREPAARSRINGKTGGYQMILNPATQYRFRIEAPSYYSTDVPYTSPAGNEYQEVEKNFSVKALPIGSTIFSGKVFAKNSTEIAKNVEFQKAVEFLQAQPYITVTVTVAPDPAAKSSAKKKKGKTDAVPTAVPSGVSLERQRIEALTAYLEERGIDTDRITWKTAEKITASASSKKRSKGAAADVSLELTGADRNISR